MITAEKLSKLESLVKIHLSDEEKTQAMRYFGYFIPKFDKLELIDTKGIEPLITPAALTNVMRDDLAVKSIDRKKLLENIHEQHDGYIVVPKVLD